MHNISGKDTRLRKPLGWVGASKKEFMAFPAPVKDVMGHMLDQVQRGEKPDRAKPLKGFGGGVLELVDRHQGNAYRAVYAVRFEEAVYVLHAFQKKSKKGIATPPQHLDTIRQRLKAVEDHYAAMKKESRR